jgi:hypothetical protein
MLLRLFILFSVVPIIEIWLLIKVGRVIGALPTVLILLAISAAGAWLAKSQGLRTIRVIRNDLEQRRVPAGAILDGALIFTGGIYSSPWILHRLPRYLLPYPSHTKPAKMAAQAPGPFHHEEDPGHSPPLKIT